MKNYELVEMDHGKAKRLAEGTLTEIINYLKANEKVYTWVRDEDPEAELPELNEAETLEDLEHELKK